jgi:hypothetical protein
MRSVYDHHHDQGMRQLQKNRKHEYICVLEYISFRNKYPNECISFIPQFDEALKAGITKVFENFIE